MRYTKTIEQTDTGMVVAKVYNATGARVGIEFFNWPWYSQRRRLERAHKWADKWIANCEELCVERPESQVCITLGQSFIESTKQLAAAMSKRGIRL